MKKISYLFCIAAFCVTFLSGCGGKSYKQLSFFLEPGSYKNSSISLKCEIPDTEDGYSFYYDFSQYLTDEDAGVFEDVRISGYNEDTIINAYVLAFDVSFSGRNNTSTHPWLYDLSGVPLSLPEDITATTFAEQFLPTCFLESNCSGSVKLINNDKVKERYSWDDVYNARDIYTYPYPCYMSTEVWQTKLAGKTYSCKEISSYAPWSVNQVGHTQSNVMYDLQRVYVRKQGKYMICILIDSSCSSVEKGREAIDVLMSYFSKA